MSDTQDTDQFQPVNRRTGYGDALSMALRIARKGGTLAAGEGALIVEHYEEQLATLRSQLTAPSPVAVGKDAARIHLDALTQKIAVEAYEHWNADRDSKVGKLLRALAGEIGIRPDLDKARIAALLAALTAPSPVAVGIPSHEEWDRLAKIVYEAMQEFADEGKRYPWVDGGNSDAQCSARIAVRRVYDSLRALTAPSPVPAITEARTREVLWSLAEAIRQAIREDSGPREESIGLTFVVEKAINKAAAALATADGQPSSAPIRTTAQSYTPYRVREDMGRADLTIVVEEDGDVIVGIARDGFRYEAQFCTPGSGGGKSPLVHAALRNLANAVASSTADGQRGEG
jgi:hypothetical protein